MKNKNTKVHENGDVTHYETYSTFKEIREKYGIKGGWHEMAQGKMGYVTNCGKRVSKDDLWDKKSTYTVYWTIKESINFGSIPCLFAWVSFQIPIYWIYEK